jgi:hypothetical protein
MRLGMAASRRLLVVGLLMAVIVPWSAGESRAEDASVLPKGVGRVTLDSLFYLPVEQRYNPHGGTEDLATDFNNRRLDSTIFSLLTPLNPFVPGGNASIGDSHVKYKYLYNIEDLGGQYGLTDRLTVGIDIPYFWASNSTEAGLNSGPGSSANVVLNTSSAATLALFPPGSPCRNPVLPFAAIPGCSAAPGFSTRRFSTADVQRLLGPGLVTNAGTRIPGFGFKKIQDWNGDGLGDITLGGKYQYLRTQDAALAVTLGARLATGRRGDPDDLSDVYWSTGANAILLRLHEDYVLSNLWNRRPPSAQAGASVSQPGDLVLASTFRYDKVLPDYATRRVPSDITNPITSNRERVYRELGDRFEIEAGLKYDLPKGFSLSALYRYGWKLKDVVVGHRGFDYRTLTQDSDSTEQIYIVGVGYSTVPLYLEKKFPIPMGVSLTYRDRFAGSGPHSAGSPSQVLDSQYFNLGLQVLF